MKPKLSRRMANPHLSSSSNMQLTLACTQHSTDLSAMLVNQRGQAANRMHLEQVWQLVLDPAVDGTHKRLSLYSRVSRIRLGLLYILEQSMVKVAKARTM